MGLRRFRRKYHFVVLLLMAYACKTWLNRFTEQRRQVETLSATRQMTTLSQELPRALQATQLPVHQMGSSWDFDEEAGRCRPHRVVGHTMPDVVLAPFTPNATKALVAASVLCLSHQSLVGCTAQSPGTQRSRCHLQGHDRDRGLTFIILKPPGILGFPPNFGAVPTP